MSTTDTGSTESLPEPDEELVCTITCMCGFCETVDEAKNGQSLGGTAGDVGARHTCRYERGEVKLPKGVQSMNFNWGFR